MQTIEFTSLLTAPTPARKTADLEITSLAAEITFTSLAPAPHDVAGTKGVDFTFRSLAHS